MLIMPETGREEVRCLTLRSKWPSYIAWDVLTGRDQRCVLLTI